MDELPYTMVGVYHTPLGRFSMLDISTTGVLPVPENVGVGNVLPRAFRRRSVRHWHSLGRAFELGKSPHGVCDINRPIQHIMTGSSGSCGGRCNMLCKKPYHIDSSIII